VHVALSNQVLHGALNGFPAAWLSRPRKQLDAFELKQRCTITWNVPAAALQAALNGGPLQEVLSPSICTAGTGFRLFVQPTRRQDGAVEYGVYVRTSSYTQHGATLCEPDTAFSCQFEVQRQAPGGGKLGLLNTRATVTALGLGRPAAIVASSPADLDPYLVDGHLKLKATVSMIRA
jgi:hypothetical protein